MTKQINNFGYLFIFAIPLYFGLNSFIQLYFDLNFYASFIIVSSIFSLFTIIYTMLINKTVKISFIITGFIFLLYSLKFIYLYYNENLNILTKNTFFYSLVWLVPATFLALNLNKLNLIFLNKIIKYFIYFMTLSLLITIVIPFVRGELTFPISYGGATYQTVSYISSLLIGLVINQSLNEKNRFILLTLPILMISMIIGGGRGALILSVLIILFFLVIHSIKLFFIISSLLSVIIFASNFIYQENQLILNRFERMTSFLNEGGNTLQSTDQRQILYKNIFEIIGEKTHIGYGIFGYLEKLNDYPHNLFLESFLIGGIGLFIFFILLNIYILFKGFLLAKNNKSFRVIFILYLYSLTLLFFSSSLLVTPEYFFSLIIILRRKNIEETNIYNIN